MAKTKKQEELLALLNSRLTLAKKFGKDYIEECEQSLKEYKIESFADLVKNSTDGDLYNKLQVPYIFSTVESGLPSMFENVPSVILSSGGKKDVRFTGFADAIWDFLKRRIAIKKTIEDVGFTFLLSGQSSLSYDWNVETAKVNEPIDEPVMDEMGQPLIDEMGQPIMQTVTRTSEVITKNLPKISYNKYNKIYFSPESYFTIDDEDNLIPYTIKEEVLDVDTVEYLYGVKVSDTEQLDLTEISDDLDNDEDRVKKAGLDKNDLERVKVFTYQGTLPKKSSPDKENWKPSDVYKTCFTKGQILKESEVIKKKKILNLGNYGSPEEFWKFGEAKILRDLENDVSFGRSIMADYRDRLSTKVAVPSGSEFDEDAFQSPKKFTFVRFVGDKYPQYMSPAPVPEVVISNMNMSREDIQMVSGQLDISRGGTSNSVDTATGQKIFESVHEKRINRKRQKIGEFMEALARNLLVMCAENMSLDEFAKITDLDPQEIAQEQYIEKLLQVGDGYDLQIDMEGVTNNKDTMSAQAIAMYREMKDRQEVNQEELLQEVIKVGFGKKDAERFLSGILTPQQMVTAIKQLVDNQVIDQQMAAGIMQGFMQTQGENGGEVGRPMTQNPTAVAEKSMPAVDNTQISAQNASAAQTGVPKGLQGI